MVEGQTKSRQTGTLPCPRPGVQAIPTGAACGPESARGGWRRSEAARRSARNASAGRPWCSLAFAAGIALSSGVAAEVAPLELVKVAEGVHVYVGPHEDATRDNLGGFGNAGVVIGGHSVAIIDSGGSLAFGRRLRASVEALTDLPIAYVINTHAHPDHAFGNAAFGDGGTTFAGHHKLGRALALRAPFYLEAFERLIGPPFEGTRIVEPDMEVREEARIDIGDRVLVLKAWRTAHTDSDLSVLDVRTGTLFAGDLLFVDRLPVVDGSLKGWLEVMEDLREIPATRVVPGHGPASAPWPRALDAQERYLRALLRDVRREIAEGGSIESALKRAAPEERGRWIGFDLSHPRNVTASFTEIEWE